MKSIFTAIIALFLLNAKAQEAVISGQTGEVPIVWTHTAEIKYHSMLIAVKLDGDTNEYFMQLDTGAPKTLFYDSEIASKTFFIGDSKIELEAINLKEQKIDEDSKLIGTIGMDVIKAGGIILNFSQHYIELNKDLSEVATHPFHYYMERILFPATIGGVQKMVLHYSGSSAFDFITDKATWRQMRDQQAPAISIPVNSWGQTMTAHIAKSSTAVEMAGESLLIDQVTYMEGASEAQMQAMIQSGMQGMIGNSIFMGKEICLDFQALKFGISNSAN